MDEQQAIACLKQGDASGLEELVRCYQTRAVHVAYLIVQDRSMAEDVAQNAFLQAYRKIGQFDNSRPFGPWFLRSVVNAAIKAADRQKWSVSLDVDEEDASLKLIEKLVDQHPGPEEITEQIETRQQVQHALEKLSLEERAAVVLRYYLELNEDEMVEKLQRPPSTVNWWLYSAKKRLRKILRPAEVEREESSGKVPIEKGSKE